MAVQLGSTIEQLIKDIPTKTSQLTNDSGFLTGHQDISGKANLAGGNSFTGTQTLTAPTSGSYSINAAGYVKGSWLQAPSTGKLPNTSQKVCVLDGSGLIYYRTPSEIISDAGLTGVLRFIGTTTTAITDGSTTNPISIGGKSVTAVSGDVTRFGGKEFAWLDGKWEELGDESSHALKTIEINAGTGLSGGGNLTENRTISLKIATADEIGGVKSGGDITVDSATGAVTVNHAATATTASKLGTNAGSASKPVYFTNGVPTACDFTVTDRSGSTKNNLKWTEADKTTKTVPTYNSIAYWDGAYQGTSSRLSYCNQGAFGTATTKNVTTTVDTSANLPTANAVKTYVDNKVVSIVSATLTKV